MKRAVDLPVKSLPRSTWERLCHALAAGFLALAVVAALAPVARAGTQTATFASTGAEQTFTVPAGVSELHVVAVGGRGGPNGSLASGGFGATASADLPVSPGQVLYVEVGGSGAAGGPSGSGAGMNGEGGFDGGGAGGQGPYSGGGGGATDIRTARATAPNSLASRLVVAGGGGGAAGVLDGGAAGASGPSPDGGGAGSQTAGGAGGVPGGVAGSAGQLGMGGDGGTGGGGGSGGGGGGGLYGGGGGASGTAICGGNYCTPTAGAPGGGGSSGFAVTATNTAVGTDTSGTPSLTITYDAVSPPTMTAALLRSQLVPSGKAAKIARILKHGGYALQLKGLTAGTVTVSWYQAPTHGHIAGAHPLLVATGSRTFTSARAAPLAIHLTSTGRELLQHVTVVKLTARAAFAPPSGTPITVMRIITLRR